MTRDDVNAIRKRHLNPEDIQGKTFYPGHVLVDLARVIDELEDRIEDREKIVDWLRSHPPIRYGEPDPTSTKEIARCIEINEHHRWTKH
jgi:hypothetical protein